MTLTLYPAPAFALHAVWLTDGIKEHQDKVHMVSHPLRQQTKHTNDSSAAVIGC
jgi:hypothetical protein